jgi:hypothetical protein
MKQLYFIFLLISSSAYSQLDSINIKKDSLSFEYRFKISKVIDDFSSSQIQDKLTDLFKTKPIFYDEFSQYVFNSREDIERYVLEKFLATQNLFLEYYRKASLIIKKDGTK